MPTQIQDTLLIHSNFNIILLCKDRLNSTFINFNDSGSLATVRDLPFSYRQLFYNLGGMTISNPKGYQNLLINRPAIILCAHSE